MLALPLVMQARPTQRFAYVTAWDIVGDKLETGSRSVDPELSAKLRLTSVVSADPWSLVRQQTKADYGTLKLCPNTGKYFTSFIESMG